MSRASRHVLVVQHQDDCPRRWWGTGWSRRAASSTYDARTPATRCPSDLAGHDAFVVLGGSMGANDDADHPWLAPTKDLVRDAAERRTPTLGICLGHQLVAVALGGAAARNPRGQQLGLLAMGWTDDAGHDDLMSGLVDTNVAVQWNDDIVTDVPAGTVVLARTPEGEIQAARFAPRMWGVQLHPEVDDRILKEWADEDPNRYAEGVIDEVLARIAAAREDLVAGWRPLAQALASLP